MQDSVDDKGLIMYVACLAAKLLAAFGLGALVRTVKVAGGGAPNWWFVAKPIEVEDREALELLGFHDESTPSFDALKAQMATPMQKPLRAPDIEWAHYAPVPGDRQKVLDFLSPRPDAHVDAIEGAAPLQNTGLEALSEDLGDPAAHGAAAPATDNMVAHPGHETEALPEASAPHGLPGMSAYMDLGDDDSEVESEEDDHANLMENFG